MPGGGIDAVVAAALPVDTTVPADVVPSPQLMVAVVVPTFCPDGSLKVAMPVMAATATNCCPVAGRLARPGWSVADRPR